MFAEYMGKRLLLYIFLASVSIPSFGQKVWSLEECINHAWENNLTVKQKMVEVERGRNNLVKSKADFAPSINADIGYHLNWGRSVDLQNLEIIRNKLSQSTSASVSASVYILDGLSKLYTLKSESKSLEISLQEVESLKNEISISIAKCYLQILLAKEILSASESNFRSITGQRDRTRLLVDAGSQPYTALLDMESQLASERLQLVTAQSQVTTSTLELMQLLDLPYGEEFAVSAPDTSSAPLLYIPENVEEIYLQAVTMPTIRSAELSVERGDLELKKAKGQYYPKISLSGSYGTFYSSSSYAPDGSTYPFFEQFRDNINPSIGIGLSIPIFNKLNVRASVRNAELTKASLEIDLQIKHQALYKEIQTAVTEAETYFRKMEAAKANTAAMEESFRYVEEKFNAGALNGTDYIVAKTNLFRAESEYLQAKYQYLFQLKIIDYYKGIPLSM